MRTKSHEEKCNIASLVAMQMSVAFGEEEVASLQVLPVLGPLRDYDPAG
jgi:hypothetical protein